MVGQHSTGMLLNKNQRLLETWIYITKKLTFVVIYHRLPHDFQGTQEIKLEFKQLLRFS